MNKDWLLNVVDYTITDLKTGTIWKGKRFVSDNDMIKQIATLWIALGGDSDGFLYSYKYILDMIRELENKEE